MQHRLCAIGLFCVLFSRCLLLSLLCGVGGCACPHVGGCRLATVSLCRLEVILSVGSLLLPCSRQGLSGFISTPYRPADIQRPRVSSFHLPCPIESWDYRHMLLCQGFVNGFQGSQLGLSALHGKHFTHGAISSAKVFLLHDGDASEAPAVRVLASCPSSRERLSGSSITFSQSRKLP